MAIEPGYNNDWAAKLADQARIMGEARMLLDDQPLTDEIKTLILQRLAEYLKRTEKSQEWAARSMGMGAPTLSQVMSSTYPGDVEKQIRAIDKWVEQQVLKESAPKPSGFVKIKIAEQIFGVARWIQKINGIGLIHGPAGIGKSITLQAVRAETPGSCYFSIRTAGQSKLSVLDGLARALRVPGMKMTANMMQDQIEGLIKDTGRLLIIDEIHKLAGRSNDDALHALRDVHDATGCPMLWSGASNIATYIETQKARFEPLDQIASRVKFWLNLTAIANQEDGGPGLYTIEDIQKWCAKRAIRITPDGVRYLQMIANTPGMGALRTCDGLLLVAAALAGEKPIGADMLRNILSQQRGTRYVEAFETQSEIRRSASA